MSLQFLNQVKHQVENYSVNKRGESIYLHNRPNYVTMGICASSPELHLPNVMLLAHSTPPSSQENISTRPARSKHVELSFRYLSLKLVDLSVHSVEERRLKLRLVNGCAYYLALCAPPEKQTLICCSLGRGNRLVFMCSYLSLSSSHDIPDFFKFFSTYLCKDTKKIGMKKSIETELELKVLHVQNAQYIICGPQATLSPRTLKNACI
uniref:Golgi associated RAB2 interactor protein-like Rab2B-binding domain-containing protein n=1 Tax=Anolis carolinensis TaxID=28377 RepID=A0A803SVC1_ANOCA